ncbi:hypothetical protein MMC13_007399 [Lambiella insularis]|nr:hypothetical protein [Lambiella insularis]
MSLKRVVLVTGGNGGIGFETVAALLASSTNYHVIVGSRSTEKGEKAVSRLKERFPDGNLSLVQLDVTDAQSIADAATFVDKQFGHLDVLVNNAGILNRSPSLITQLRTTFETNVFAPAVVTDAFLALLQKSSDPRLIYVSSSLGSITLRLDASRKQLGGAVAYRASKAALDMLAACHHADYGETIKVFAFDPGLVVTNLAGEDQREALAARGAGSAAGSAQTALSIIDERRDADVGRFLYKEGVHPW